MLDRNLARAAFRTRAATASGYPSIRIYAGGARVAGQPYVEHDFAPSPGELRTIPGNGGLIRETGLSVFRWYIPVLADITTPDNGVSALLAKFTPGTTLTLTGGTNVRVMGRPAPYASEWLNTGDGWKVSTITIPWQCWTRNAVAA